MCVKAYISVYLLKVLNEIYVWNFRKHYFKMGFWLIRQILIGSLYWKSVFIETVENGDNNICFITILWNCKLMFSFGHCPNEGGEGRALPELNKPASLEATLVRNSAHLGEPNSARSAVFLNIVQKAFDPPPPFVLNIMLQIFFDGFLKKRVNVCRDKIRQNNA